MPFNLRLLAPVLGAASLFALSACASAPRVNAPAAVSSARALPEPVALSLIDRLLLEQRQVPAPRWRVDLGEREGFEVDVRVGTSHFGIEWVSARDRAADGAALPEPDPSGQLRVVRALAASEPALILVLDDRSYRVARSESASAAESERALERRLRSDLQDFLAYASNQPLALLR